MIEQHREDMLARSAAWDDLRERRVLSRIEAELDARGGRRSRSARPFVLALAATMTLAAALVAFWIVRGPSARAVAPSFAALEPPTRALAGTLALPDGSVAMLHDGALVDMRIATATEIRLEQSGGRVHYDVVPGLARAFTVVAGDVEVHVVGTAFWVAHDGTHVGVTVDHGRVRVARASGSLVAELGAGEEVRVETGALARAEPVGDAIELVPPAEVGGDDEPRRPRVRKPAKATTEEVAPAIESAALLQARADDARRRGDAAEAADALRALIDHHPKDVRVYTALFTLAKVERGRGRHAAAAALFASVVSRDPNGALAEDARAEAASSWSSAGRHDDAREAANDYLAKHPAGAHVGRMQRLLAKLP
jgi:hypothetical protein